MDYLQVGKYTNTHGLKGEIKIISDIKSKNNLFVIGRTIYIGNNKTPYIIKTYRKHQKYDMITLDGLTTIEQVLPFKGKLIYINKADIDENIIENLIDYDVYNNDELIGKVIEIMKGVKYDFIVVGNERLIVPFIDNFIISVDNNQKLIKISFNI